MVLFLGLFLETTGLLDGDPIEHIERRTGGLVGCYVLMAHNSGIGVLTGQSIQEVLQSLPLVFSEVLFRVPFPVFTSNQTHSYTHRVHTRAVVSRDRLVPHGNTGTITEDDVVIATAERP